MVALVLTWIGGLSVVVAGGFALWFVVWLRQEARLERETHLKEDF